MRRLKIGFDNYNETVTLYPVAISTKRYEEMRIWKKVSSQQWLVEAAYNAIFNDAEKPSESNELLDEIKARFEKEKDASKIYVYFDSEEFYNPFTYYPAKSDRWQHSATIEKVGMVEYKMDEVEYDFGDACTIVVCDEKNENMQEVAITPEAWDLLYKSKMNGCSAEEMAEGAYMAIFCDKENTLNPTEVLNVAYRIFDNFKNVWVTM